MTSSPSLSAQGGHYDPLTSGKARSQNVQNLLRVAASSKAFLSLPFTERRRPRRLSCRP